MDEITKTRWKVLTVLAGIVIAVHLVLICVFVSNGSSSSEKAKEKLPDKKTAPAVKKPAPPVYRYFVPSKNPLFGLPLDYSTAIKGNLPAKTVPGSAEARSGIIVDMDTRRVLWEKNSSRPVPIASMAKMMTMLLVMEQLEKRPQIGLNTPVTVTQTARNVPRTGVLYLAPGEQFTVQELMIATAVKSANDAATLLAEYFGGTVPVFVAMMNRKAQQLQLRQTSFLNPCGLPSNNQNSLVWYCWGNSCSSTRC